MMNHWSISNNKSSSNRSGQVAIFIALIFQLLFLFFAMIVNVGLLVHHKINLQNSVDLSAYYGAMKQAEVMNAIAHVNYQIRQSYKLGTWRYRILGTSGVFPNPPEGCQNAHPVQKGSVSAVGSGTKGGSIIGGQDYEGLNPDCKDFNERPAFCIAFRPFHEIPEGESTCQTPMGQTIPALVRPPIIAGFIGAAHTAAQVTDLANDSQKARCEYAGPYNYFALARFIVAGNIDQGNRKLLVYKLANGLSQAVDNFVDIEGEQASDGMKKTLEGNLTAANKDALKDGVFKIYNGLGHPDCAEAGGGQKPPKWMSDVIIFPRSTYKMCTWSGGTNLTPQNIENSPIDIAGAGAIPGELLPGISYLAQYLMPPATGAGAHLRPSLGVEKNPWCMAYVGARAETEPAIPFALGKVKLKAVAFAKPFGGRIGPWYGKTWPRSAEESQGNGESTRSDPRTPIRCKLGDVSNCAVTGSDAATTINYSRFPGDPWGLSSRRVQGQYGKSIFDMGNPSLNIWQQIELESKDRGGEWDMLAWEGSPNGKMRQLEVSAVVPDLFDLTYYSIDPDFYNNYYKGRIETYLQKHPISVGGSSYTARMDIGSRKNGTYNGKPMAGFNIKDQMKLTGVIRDSSPNGYGIDYSSKLLYLLADASTSVNTFFGRLLTGWIPPRDITDYEFKPDERFGQCSVAASDSAPVPGSCEKGGRTGYSVKMISSDYLLDVHELGGQGGSTDHIKNPPPHDFYE